MNNEYCTSCNETLTLHADGSIACACDFLDADAPTSKIPASWKIDAERVLGMRVCEKLGISDAELNSMYTAVPVDGWVGVEVAKRIEPVL